MQDGAGASFARLSGLPGLAAAYLVAQETDEGTKRIPAGLGVLLEFY